ncbi:two-component response regulator-like APRR5 isoform X1 [Amaranthus tricolor]|uniref:two-component response regulator-like APRR5 isoform X1 n=1 Tax=Amaranthus tricolor TaxID=29722 RepID=UPI00258997A5|nr:two-component response regulator-like APRR5 isoform X1 [Amaranthus tricolor]
MGEVVVSSEEVIEIMDIEKEIAEKKEGSSSLLKRESFLPRIGMRILLVEADDSTRQIIGALLRKCSYKVASVADGLKAWELLKTRPYNIDLILTETELPSISGYALLTLIMEHEICKNTPVIMMSSHDTVSMVYKCMMRGAADFLIKPVRINELKNLWQHVWRRKSQLSIEVKPQNASVAQEKLEATAENNAESNHSSSSKTRVQGQDQSRKGSDAQSSCGKLDLEAESADMVEVVDYSQPKQGVSPSSELMIQEQGNFGNSSQNLLTPESAVAGSDTAACNSNNPYNQDQKEEQECHEENENHRYVEANESRDARTSSFREAIDLIGALDNHSRHNTCSNDEVKRSEPSQQLDLTLRRFLPGVLDNKTINENQTLNHSNASAFTRYINKALHNPNSGPSDKYVHLSDHLSDNVPSYDKRVITHQTELSKEVENEYRNASQKLFPIPLPVRGVRVDVCPVRCTRSPSPSPSSANRQMNSYHQFSIDAMNRRQHYNPFEPSTRFSTNQPVSIQDHNLESLEERNHFSCAADQSASSSLHNDTAGNDPSQVTHELNRQRSLQREAALNKFRLKRKERCYDKKVRYESRKKLAEQRPRVKGQFVRQVPPDPPPQNSDHFGGNATVT